MLLMPNVGHGSAGHNSAIIAVGWMADRFAAVAANLTGRLRVLVAPARLPRHAMDDPPKGFAAKEVGPASSNQPQRAGKLLGKAEK
jgi:hypothetical protein